MRTEQEMMDAILTIAKKEERIRVVYMNGSRTNSNVPKDLFQDYDIVYVVTDIAPFIQEQQWLKKFGEPLMIQEPDQLDAGIGINRDFSRRYAFLMLFTDGNRIDLTLQTKETMREVYDTLTVPLLDKDHCLPPDPATVR